MQVISNLTESLRQPGLPLAFHVFSEGHPSEFAHIARAHPDMTFYLTLYPPPDQVRRGVSGVVTLRVSSAGFVSHQYYRL